MHKQPENRQTSIPFSKKDIAEYYDTTQNHYEMWWKLNDHHSLHYGIWDEGTKTFGEALINTNKILLEKAKISESDKVLDAGCGIGGAAFFINKITSAHVTGISLSEKQIKVCRDRTVQRSKTEVLDFKKMDFTATEFPDESFDVVWACESVCHTPNKGDFVRESFRLLKPGGRLVLSDFFKTNAEQTDKSEWLRKWADTWAVPGFDAVDEFTGKLKDSGFVQIQSDDYTEQIHKTARRMYQAALLGAVPSTLYNLVHPKVPKFARTHFKCGYYQYKGLQENLWRYVVVTAQK